MDRQRCSLKFIIKQSGPSESGESRHIVEGVEGGCRVSKHCGTHLRPPLCFLRGERRGRGTALPCGDKAEGLCIHTMDRSVMP